MHIYCDPTEPRRRNSCCVSRRCGGGRHHRFHFSTPEQLSVWLDGTRIPACTRLLTEVQVNLNGLAVARLSCCCEYRHGVGTRLGGRAAGLVVTSIEGGRPCIECRVKQHASRYEIARSPPRHGGAESKSDPQPSSLPVATPEPATILHAPEIPAASTSTPFHPSHPNIFSDDDAPTLVAASNALDTTAPDATAFGQETTQPPREPSPYSPTAFSATDMELSGSLSLSGYSGAPTPPLLSSISQPPAVVSSLPPTPAVIIPCAEAATETVAASPRTSTGTQTGLGLAYVRQLVAGNTSGNTAATQEVARLSDDTPAANHSLEVRLLFF